VSFLHLLVASLNGMQLHVISTDAAEHGALGGRALYSDDLTGLGAVRSHVLFCTSFTERARSRAARARAASTFCASLAADAPSGAGLVMP
jgi:hypothetical protein